MTSAVDTEKTLSRYYDSLEHTFPVTSSDRYSQLVTPNGNSSRSIHRWFHLKEAYSCNLLGEILNETGLDQCRHLQVLDPFSGVGTTATSLGELVAADRFGWPTIYGLECNPFLHLVAATKLSAMQQPPKHFVRFARKLAAKVLRATAPPSVPELSTFHRQGFFDRIELDRLLLLRAAIDEEESEGVDQVVVSLARVCLGSIVEAVSNLRRDGRALRYVKKQARQTAVQAFLDRAEIMGGDLPLNRISLCGQILRGDGRLLEGLHSGLAPFDLAVFSPPYPNNIDYTEVYKLENWLLGFIDDNISFTRERNRTVYSHPSILRPEPLPSQLLSAEENETVAESVASLVAAVPRDRYTRARIRMFRGYALDMYLTLRSVASQLRDGGWLVYVVGNSVHGRASEHLVVAADLLIAKLATSAGYRVEKIEIARRPMRRVVPSPYVRESVVFLRRIG